MQALPVIVTHTIWKAYKEGELTVAGDGLEAIKQGLLSMQRYG